VAEAAAPVAAPVAAAAEQPPPPQQPQEQEAQWRRYSQQQPQYSSSRLSRQGRPGACRSSCRGMEVPTAVEEVEEVVEEVVEVVEVVEEAEHRQRRDENQERDAGSARLLARPSTKTPGGRRSALTCGVLWRRTIPQRRKTQQQEQQQQQRQQQPRTTRRWRWRAMWVVFLRGGGQRRPAARAVAASWQLEAAETAAGTGGVR
jgi:hypothetical protein